MIFYLVYSNYNLIQDYPFKKSKMMPMVNYNNNLWSQQRIQHFTELPIHEQRRRVTDVCCCGLGILFFLIMLIVAASGFSKYNLQRANFPTDNSGHLCAYDKNSRGQLFPYMYFSDLNNPLQNRYCVADCPQPGVKTMCWDGQCNIGYYPNYPLSDRLGSYCLPQDQTARNKLIADTRLNLLSDNIQSIDVLLISFGISVGLSILWMILVHYLPKIMVWVAFVLAIILLIITALLFFISNSTSLYRGTGWGIVIGILALIVAVFLIVYLILHNRRVRYCGIFLQNASHMLKQKCIMVLYILLFMVLTILFCILIVFMYVAFSSRFEPVFKPSSLYGQLYKSFWWMAPLLILTLWGLSFLRDAFNFVISGCAIQWYFHQPVNCCHPLKILVTKHLGSIAGGSFLNAFLFIPNLFVDLCCNNINCICCNCCDLPRQDAYPYIYLTSVSYCPAVRQVQYLCKRSRICKGNQSTNFYYSLAARLVIGLLSMLIAYWIMQGKLSNGHVNPYVLLGVFFMSMFVTGYFVDIHVYIAQALMICFLAEWEMDMPSYTNMNIARDQMKNVIDDLDRKYLATDNFKPAI